MMHGKQFQGIATSVLWRMIDNDRKRRRERHQPLWAAVIIHKRRLGYRGRARTKAA